MIPVIFKWFVILMVIFATFLLVLMAVGTTVRGMRERKKTKERKNSCTQK
ncbi:hypothetical protein [Desulfurobacterium atlanticum]|uniref:Uncharacterized protein n=1 Tax=Desulfurobacterium atlanticum TaxID=240169 RepID=A0A238YVU7_9BACT|nr:hypothetical protein [Desulfurobacterium atlanticum]SNR75170.1 hypothetical protein SAMN06265340_10542 [Desulfurobacterium atlanticum]